MAFVRDPKEEQTSEVNTAPTLGGGSSTFNDTSTPAVSSAASRVAQPTTTEPYTPIKTLPMPTQSAPVVEPVAAPATWNPAPAAPVQPAVNPLALQPGQSMQDWGQTIGNARSAEVAALNQGITNKYGAPQGAAMMGDGTGRWGYRINGQFVPASTEDVRSLMGNDMAAQHQKSTSNIW